MRERMQKLKKPWFQYLFKQHVSVFSYFLEQWICIFILHLALDIVQLTLPCFRFNLVHLFCQVTLVSFTLIAIHSPNKY